MTDANTQPKMAANADAMTAVPQLPPAIGSQPMAVNDAFCQDAWTHRYEAETYYGANGCIVFTLLKGLPCVSLPRKAIMGGTRFRRLSVNGTGKVAASHKVRP